MRYHKSSTSTSLLERGPSNLAKMVASEFWRAHQGAEFHDEAIRCFWRARELMGVLEVANLPAEIGCELRSLYEECRLDNMRRHEGLDSSALQQLSLRMATEFDRAAERLAHA